MKRLIPLLALLIIAIGLVIRWQMPAENPDPNHTHADFAVFIRGKQVDFGKAQYMSGASTGSLLESDHQAHDPYYHLHDGNGDVIHRHKPGLPIGQFFQSIGFKMTKDCFALPSSKPLCNQGASTWKMFVNGQEKPFDPNYVFEDLDKVLLTYGGNQAEIERELAAMTDEACLYSKTCPERGDPPTEGCIADPKVPCVE